jgi:hypothetical protein
MVSFIHGETASGTQWIRGWVRPRATLGVMEWMIAFPCQESSPDSSVLFDYKLTLNKYNINTTRYARLEFGMVKQTGVCAETLPVLSTCKEM